ncbi:hypothetical protein CYMTET_11006 [Cymbomonas tetramitiformis]|uniref:Uncharacterized protein n=1 Tax=Cymbomonas tetramitiformis TaxID=36881 RepID=A0AAE0GNA0_9CHLO|nr:hypothetical protein CYMTET_11006 [Cymbomonas tetramitiformis]
MEQKSDHSPGGLSQKLLWILVCISLLFLGIGVKRIRDAGLRKKIFEYLLDENSDHVKGDTDSPSLAVQCCVCDTTISLGATPYSVNNINTHCETSKHREAVGAANESRAELNLQLIPAYQVITSLRATQGINNVFTSMGSGPKFKRIKEWKASEETSSGTFIRKKTAAYFGSDVFLEPLDPTLEQATNTAEQVYSWYGSPSESVVSVCMDATKVIGQLQYDRRRTAVVGGTVDQVGGAKLVVEDGMTYVDFVSQASGIVEADQVNVFGVSRHRPASCLIEVAFWPHR